MDEQGNNTSVNRNHSAGAIIIYKNGQTDPTLWETIVVLGLKYLTKHQSVRYFSFPKGHVELEETKLEAAFREIYEETGIEKQYLKLISTQEPFTIPIPNKEDRNVYLFLMHLKEKRSEWKPIDTNVELFQYVTFSQILHDEEIPVLMSTNSKQTSYHLKPEFVKIVQENWNHIIQSATVE